MAPRIVKPKSKEYRLWSEAKYRCQNPNNKRYEYYGARGIRMCKQWADSFAQFMADMGPRPVGMTLERINNDGNYEPRNCRWATIKEQARNRRSNIMITHAGETLTIVEWSERTGIRQGLLYDRYARNGERGLFGPVLHKSQKYRDRK